MAAEGRWPRGEGISPTLHWLFEGAGYAYVTLTVDALLLLAALLIADAINPEPPSVLVLLASPLAVALMASRRLYDPTAQIARLDRIGSIIGATAVAAIAIAGVVQLTKPAATDADLIAIQLGLAAGMLIVWRMLFSTARIFARRTGRSGRRTIIVGAGQVGARLERRLDDLRQIGLVPVGFIDADPVPTLELRERRAPVLGGPEDFDAIVDATGAEHAIFAFQIEPDVTLRGLVRRCRQRGLGIAIVPRLFDDATNRMVLEHVGGIPVFELRQVDPKGWEFSLKHGIDRVTAGIMLLLLSPVLGAVALAVRLTMGAPVLFRQRRVGRDGQVFDLLKFRSMRPAEPGETPTAARGDSAPGGVEGVDRRTPVGRFIRRWHLDELPQLINVLRGEMSLIGPRPERPELAHDYVENVNRYGERHRVRSGITGWAQVNGLVPGTSLGDRAELDNWYIQNWSFWLDFKIALMTIPAAFRKTEP